MLSRRNKLCFTGGTIEGESDFILGQIAATLCLLFSSICSWYSSESHLPWHTYPGTQIPLAAVENGDPEHDNVLVSWFSSLVLAVDFGIAPTLTTTSGWFGMTASFVRSYMRAEYKFEWIEDRWQWGQYVGKERKRKYRFSQRHVPHYGDLWWRASKKCSELWYLQEVRRHHKRD